MSGIAKGLIGIGKSLAGIVSSIGKTVIDIVKSVSRTVSSIAASLGISVTKLLGPILKPLSEVMPKSLLKIAPILSKLASYVIPEYGKIEPFVTAILDKIRSFQKAIHTKIKANADKINETTKAGYQNMMGITFRQVAKVSKQLELGDYTLTHILENARSMAMSSANITGSNYELFQLAWMSDQKVILQKMSKDIHRYKKQPENLIADIDGWVISKVLGVSAKTQLFTFVSLEKLAEGLKRSVEDAEDIRDKLNKHIDKLPGFIKKRIEPEVEKLNKMFDKFIDDTYKPTAKAVDKAIDNLKYRTDKQGNEITGILKRIKYPGSYLTEIDELEADERLDQEGIISDVTRRVYDRTTSKFSSESQKARNRLSDQRDALKRKLPPLPWAKGKVKLPEKATLTPASTRETWFVGEH